VAQFSYSARNSTGVLVSGEIDSVDEKAVHRALLDSKLFPVLIRKKQDEQTSAKFSFERKPKAKDLANMVRQMHVMFAAGMPINQIFNILVRQTVHKGLKSALMGIQKNIDAGLSLSQSFRQYPKYFDLLFVSMIQAGEIGGILHVTLRALAAILEKEHWLKAKIKSAMLYPKLVGGALIAVTIIVLVFVIPTFKSIYSKLGNDLPLPTRIMMGTSDALTHYWYIFIALAIASFFGYRRFARSERGRWIIDYATLRIPVLGKLSILTENARFAHLMSALYKSGLPFAYGISITAKTISNVCFAKELLLLQERVNQGLSLAKGLESALYFTPLIREMCMVGEQTGKIDETLQMTAAFYDEEIDGVIKNLTTLIEPMLLALMFGVVLVLALAVYLPIWNLSSALLKH